MRPILDRGFLATLTMSVVVLSTPAQADDFKDCGDHCYAGTPGVVKESSVYSCDSDWNGSCGSGSSGVFHQCVPDTYQICGYKSEVLSRKNGAYGMDSIQKNCISGAMSSRGSGNIFDRWGGTIVVRLTIYSHPLDYVPSNDEKLTYCKIERDGNPPREGCECNGPVMMCGGTPAGACGTYPPPWAQ